MRSCLTVISKIIASIFAILFTLVAIVILLLYSIVPYLLQPDIYKQSMRDAQIYSQFPKLIAEELTYMWSINPCEQNPQSCENEDQEGEGRVFTGNPFASASPELTDCAKQALGEEKYQAVITGKKDLFTPGQHVEALKACIKQYGFPPGLSSSQGGMPTYLWILDQKDWELLITELLPASWLQAQFEGVIDQIFTILNDENASRTVKVPLGELKTRLAGEPGIQFAMLLIQAQPACTAEQLANLPTQAPSPGITPEIPICKPPQLLMGQLTDYIKPTLQQVANQIPAEAKFDLPEKLGESDPENVTPDSGPIQIDSLNDPRQVYQLVNRVIQLSPLLPLVLLLLVTAFGVRCMKGWMLWWGIPFLLVGLVGSASAYAAKPLYGWLVNNYIINGNGVPSGLSPNIIQAGLEVSRLILANLARVIGVYSLIFLGLGMLMLVVSFFVNKPAKNEQNVKVV